VDEDVEITVERRDNVVIRRTFFPGVPGHSAVKMRLLEPGVWWIDLIRVGHPCHRGKGLGSIVLDDVVRHLLEEEGAKNVGLEAHPVGRERFDLVAWYRRHGFVHEDDDGMWLRPR
jgi:GNAT superfamily N-acetyltransferase